MVNLYRRCGCGMEALVPVILRLCVLILDGNFCYKLTDKLSQWVRLLKVLKFNANFGTATANSDI